MKSRHYWIVLLLAVAAAAAQAATVAGKPGVPLPAGPTMLIVSCDPGGCWDEYGTRYDAAGGGVFIRRDGASCQSIRGRMHCP